MTMAASKVSIALTPARRQARRPAAQQSRQHARQRPAEHMFERAGEQHDEALDDDDHVAADLRLVEGEFGAALIEHAEQDRRQNDADRMRAAHQRHRDADEAEAAGKFEDQPMLLAEDDIDREAAGQRAGHQRRDDGDARRRNAAIDGGGRIGADGADFIAEPRAPDQHPDAERGDQAPGRTTG